MRGGGSQLMNQSAEYAKHDLETLRTGLLDLLLRCGCVKGICVFGSFGSGCWDEWSDIDLMLGCHCPESDAAGVIAAINASFPILAYRPFEDKSPRSGRYWFRDLSPFNKLDVSFHEYEEWRRLVEEEKRKGPPVSLLREMEVPSCWEETPFEWSFSDTQRQLADILHRVSRYWRRYIRQGTDHDKLCIELNAASNFLSSRTASSPEERAWWDLAERTLSATGWKRSQSVNGK